MIKNQSREFSDKILNPVEQAEVQKFVENQTMFEAVKKILLAGIYFNGTLRAGEPADPTRNFTLSLVARSAQNGEQFFTNEQLGQDLRACSEGIRLVESGLKSLENYKTPPKPVGSAPNPAI